MCLFNGSTEIIFFSGPYLCNFSHSECLDFQTYNYIYLWIQYVLSGYIFLYILHILSTLKFLCEVSCTVEFYALSHRYLEIWKETNGKCQAWREKNLRIPGLGLQ